ncbi:xylosidase : arab-like proteininofuranosidase [Bisporella sp. PMI_857]|nr:xylosidase : arab-like proteininofuranosidase [Bisporella sp. PMI_857]
MGSLLPILCIFALLSLKACAVNTTYSNPILPGFHPDPSCIFVKSWNETFFCVTSSFLAFPGIPLHASRDLQEWTLISNVFNRPSQLPELASLISETSGLWAPTIRYRDNIFYVSTTLVDDTKNISDTTQWNNVLFTTRNPYDPKAWSDPIHFKFDGYDPSIFWDDNGQAFVVGAHPWQVRPGIDQATLNTETGEVGQQVNIWNGTGGLAPEGPRLLKKDGFYYLIIAEGGTFLSHMATIARSKSITGPYESNPANPFLTNANTSEYFQAVGHADLFPDANGNWWGVALAMRPDLINFAVPMGRETVLYPVTWTDAGWPIAPNVKGQMSGWSLQARPACGKTIGEPIGITEFINFAPGSSLPDHFVYQRFPDTQSYAVSPPGHDFSLRLIPSSQNLTGQDGIIPPNGPSFVARRQTDTLFAFSVDLDFQPQQIGEEAGVTLFISSVDHIGMGLVLLPNISANASGSPSALYFRLSGQSEIATIEPTLLTVPNHWYHQSIRMGIEAINGTHYAFWVAPEQHRSQAKTISYIRAGMLRTIYTGMHWIEGTVVGVYATSNGANGTTPAYVRNWKYHGREQFRD